MQNENRIIKEEAWNDLIDIYSSIVETINKQDELLEDDYHPIFDNIDWYDQEEADIVLEQLDSGGFYYY